MLLTDGPDAGCRKPDAGALRPEEASALKPEWAELEHFAPLKRTPGDLNKKKNTHNYNQESRKMNQ